MRFRPTTAIARVSVAVAISLGASVITASADLGDQPRAVILCRFADATGITPVTREYIQGLFGDTAPGQSHYWHDIWYGALSLAGTTVYGWYNLPHPQSYYTHGSAVVEDCLAAADPDVYFPSFEAIDFIMNVEWHAFFQLVRTRTLDGVEKLYWQQNFQPSELTSASVAAKLAFLFNWPTFHDGSGWHVTMSPPTCPVSHPLYGCTPVHVNMAYKDDSQWVPSARRYDAPRGTSADITITRSATPDTSGYLMAKIPLCDLVTHDTRQMCSDYYVVEARGQAGYDSGVLGDAVIIHKVDITYTNESSYVRDVKLVRTSANASGDAEAMWTVGETFRDKVAGITVTVNSASSAGYPVTISRDPPPPAATLLSPEGSSSTATPTFVWNAAPTATRYRLWINDRIAAPRHNGLYTSAALGCPNDTDICSRTPGIALEGPVRWWVQSVNLAGDGAWSTPFDFTIGDPPAATSLISPSGTTASSSSFQWNAVSGASSYFVWINDSSATPKFSGWFSADAAGCGSGSGMCSVTPAIVLAQGYGRWWVRTANSGGLGPWSAPLDFVVSPLAAATLISPTGGGATTSPVYTWNAVANATYYYLWVNDETAAPRITQWFSAAAAGCASGSGTCSGDPGRTVSGASRWWIRVWNETQGYGPWSPPLYFDP